MSCVVIVLYAGDVTVYFFFFQAEDGIRDVAVTGVQTCALPIWEVPGISYSRASPMSTRSAPFTSLTFVMAPCLPSARMSKLNSGVFPIGRPGDRKSVV